MAMKEIKLLLEIKVRGSQLKRYKKVEFLASVSACDPFSNNNLPDCVDLISDRNLIKAR